MAEEKKPKIDLKARLGKNMVGAGGAAGTPAPVVPPAAGSVPPPAIPAPAAAAPAAPAASGGRASIPPPAMSPGIPVPPFAAAAPIDNPFAPKAPAPPPAPPPKPAEIKVEVGAEAVEAAKKSRKFIGVAGAVGVVLGIGIGWSFGGNAERGRREVVSIQGAADLVKDVEASNAKVKDLAAKIKAAGDSMKQKKFPETFVTELGALNIPFDGDKLQGKGIGGFDAKTLNLVFQYTTDVAALNSRKDALKSLFSGQKKAIQDVLEEKPVMKYSVIITKGPKGAAASLVPISEPFLLSGDWPKDFKAQDLVNRQVLSLTRYDSGEPFSTQQKQLGIPLEPVSTGAAFPNDISTRVLSELSKTATILNGVKASSPDEEDQAGVIRNGELLVEALKKIAAKK